MCIRDRDTDPKLPRIVDQRDHVEALADQLSKPRAAETATAHASDLPEIIALLDQPLRRLEMSQDSAANAAARIVASRTVEQARAHPNPELVAHIGNRSDHHDPLVWDNAVAQVALYEARTGAGVLSKPPVDAPGHEINRPQKAIRDAEASLMISLPTKELAERRAELVAAGRSIDPSEPDHARRDHQQAFDAMAGATAQFEHATQHTRPQRTSEAVTATPTTSSRLAATPTHHATAFKKPKADCPSQQPGSTVRPHPMSTTAISRTA